MISRTEIEKKLGLVSFASAEDSSAALLVDQIRLLTVTEQGTCSRLSPELASLFTICCKPKPAPTYLNIHSENITATQAVPHRLRCGDYSYDKLMI